MRAVAIESLAAAIERKRRLPHSRDAAREEGGEGRAKCRGTWMRGRKLVGLRHEQKGRDDVTEYITLASFSSTEFRSAARQVSHLFRTHSLPSMNASLPAPKSFRDYKFGFEDDCFLMIYACFAGY